jgi:hypothetical protein
MNTTSAHPNPVRPSRTRRTVGTLALTLSATALATAASIGLGATPPSAQADPGDTYVAIGTSQLVQSEDLTAIQVPLDAAAVRVSRDTDFSACLGEGNSWTSVLKGAAKPMSVTWTRTGRDDQALYETIGQADSAAQAQAYATTLIKSGIKACQQPKFDFHYGPLQSSRVGSGYATWALAYRGKETKPSGGVVVIRKGTNVGLVEVSGRFGPVDQTMESVAKVTTSRLF